MAEALIRPLLQDVLLADLLLLLFAVHGQDCGNRDLQLASY